VSSYGVYVHIPFCATRCDYCDFATWTDRGHLVDDYVDACVADYRRRVAAGDVPAATSVFFGGGTPSSIPADRLLRILDAIHRTPGAEVTVECNPDSVDRAKLEAYRAGGVTRLSFGVQSMRAHVLESLGRTHRTANVTRAVEAARAVGFDSFNLDLIYGAATETLDDWRATLDAALALDPPHVSAYALTVEAGTPLASRIASGDVDAPDDDDQAAKYDIADAALGAAGLEWYEISNWARPGHACRHNLGYWDGSDYLALGCAAHGYTAGVRWWTVRTPERYVARIAAGESPVAGSEARDAGRSAEERLALGLRTSRGAVLPRPALGEAASLADAGLLDLSDRRAVLTRTGRRLASEVTVRLLHAADAPETGPAPETGGAGLRGERAIAVSASGPAPEIGTR
jgi:putative oxygen-independent coproporphyrinogen III oxidase